MSMGPLLPPSPVLPHEVTSCSVCGSLVLLDLRERHRMFHEALAFALGSSPAVTEALKGQPGELSK